MSFWVYMLRCVDGSIYTGHTDNVQKRVAQHQDGAIPACYTTNRLPVKLIFSQPFPTREEALRSECQIKGWSRAKKEALAHGDWTEIARLACAKNRPPFDGLRANGRKNQTRTKE